jgi:GH15 family glucan-1,4-alpha-glucosidase
MSTISKRIEDYALIGNLRTAALVGTDGSIDWLSLPRFDSPAIFAALLGTDDHGHWVLAPTGKDRCTRRDYRPGTLILETDWTTANGAVRVTDFMDPTSPTPQVIRIVDGLVGAVQMHTQLAPRFDYGLTRPVLNRIGSRVAATSGHDALWLDTDVPVLDLDAAWDAQFTVAAGERVAFTLTHKASDATLPGEPTTGQPTDQLDETVQLDPVVQLTDTGTYWNGWTSRSTYTGPWGAEVNQSLVLLKALTYAPTGSILAAATTSLPELVGGSRNWDYRYSWLRDATFTIRAFLATGHHDEAIAWRNWLANAVADDPADVRIMYGIDGTRDLPEQTLDWLPGHAGSAPVRIGNAASTQQQNDIWGEVLDTLQAMQHAGLPKHPDEEKLRSVLLEGLLATWDAPDHGLWEIRGPRRHFVHSKLMAWVGLDRSIQALEQPSDGASGAPLDLHHTGQLEELRALRDAVHAELLTSGFDPARHSFTQSYGSGQLDAAVLLIPAYGFLPWDDPHVVATVDTVQRELTDDGLVLRYATETDRTNIDGVPGTEGVFLATSFWLADALHEIGRRGEARDLFERLLGLRNDVGLLSEEYDPGTGHHLGNTPQAFSHAAIVTTAVRLSQPAHHAAGTAAFAPDPSELQALAS